jgi:transcriptional regulator with XRE-family HTH domain
MGRSQRPRPIHLAKKLLQIRLSLGLTQQELLERLDYQWSPLFIGHISQFEHSKREPPLPLLLRYARISGVSLEVLVDDELDLPETVKVAIDL